MTNPAESSGARRPRWRTLLWIIPTLLVLATLVVVAANGIRSLDPVQSFLGDYPGETPLPAYAPVGFPAWLAWQHFLNSFFLLFIVRSGWEIRQGKRPSVFWKRRNTGLIRTSNPPIRLGLPTWFHLSVTGLWLLNGLVLYVLLFTTGQWVRTVPTSWEIVPNAISAGLQYASLSWPTENGWVNYNSLQVLSYFAVTFIAAPLAILTGVRLTPGLAARLRPLDRIVPLKLTRTVHWIVMVFFVAFVVIHVTLVLATGALRNLNHMYALRDEMSWIGFGIFASSIVVSAVAWVAARPSILARIAERTGEVRRR